MRIEIDTNNISVNLVYSGELDDDNSDKQYYVTKSQLKNKPNNFIPVSLPNSLNHLKNNNIFPNNKNTYVFYLIRHGQGEHNTFKGLQKKRKGRFW